MEFVGRTVRKKFDGFGTFSGTVQSNDAGSGFFRVVYEDGDSEELELPEIASLLDEQPPGKRRRGEMARRRSGNGCGDSGDDEVRLRSAVSDENLGECGVGIKGGSREGLNLNVAVEEAAEVNSRDGVVCNGHVREGLDLNSGLNLNEGFSLNDGCDLSPEDEVSLEKGGGIDLNLVATSEMDDNSRQADVSQRKKCLFDLNLGVDNETEDVEFETSGLLGQIAPFRPVDGNSEEASVDVEVKLMDDHIAEVKTDADELTSVRRTSSSADIAFEASSLVPVEVVSGDIMGNSPSGVLDEVDIHVHSLPHSDNSREPGGTPDNVNQSDLGNSYRRVSSRRRKRKAVDSSPEPVLRRSARRGSTKNTDIDIVKSTVVRGRARRGSTKNPDIETVKSTVVRERASSPSVSAITEEKPEDISATPPKLSLPPSSRTLDLDGMSILDVFSVYSCLRSFSMLLYLSPFDLGDFVSALRSESPSTLFDCIHVTLLQILRKHLEHLSSEGSASALDCLRSLNWDLLDLITWPLFLAEYLLLHGSVIKLSELSSLKLFTSDYCKHPVSVKLDILRCLCDEVMEAEVIRSELSARSFGVEPDLDFDRSLSVKTTRKRRAVVGNSGKTYFSDELTDDTADPNSDECCLCKMDGNLICCDGCPAAYHSRCVGLVSDLLPEGDWYCPECAIERNKSQIKQRRPLRGAELLGFDAHNRLYFSCCDYLLVSDSYGTEVSYNFYHQKDLTAVIEILKSSEYYSDLLKAIYKTWDVSASLGGTTSDVDSVKCIVQKKILSKRDHPAASFGPVALPNPTLSSDICEAEDDKTLGKDSHFGGSTGLDAEQIGRDPTSGMETVYVSSEGSAEIAASSGSHIKDGYLAPTPSAGKPDNISNAAPSDTSLTLNTMKEDESEGQYETGYMNYYTFGKVAAPVVEELLGKVKLNKDVLLSEDEIISQQTRAISKNLNRFYWPNDTSVGAKREKCGWCFSCRTSGDEIDCLFNTYMGPVYGGSDIDMVLVRSLRNKSSHFIGVVGGILSIEDRLRGLLLGPWLNPRHTEKWRQSAVEASDIAVIKSLLLKLASNLHHLAISEEWTKYEDSGLVLGSASHIVTSSTSASSKPGPGRKRGRPSDPDSKPSSSASSGPGMFCWRGGRLSRSLFSWKLVPRSLASKAARQGGRTKIPGILYPENSDFARRSKYLAWQAAVESSTSISQLALQVREFDSNVRWDDIENTEFLCKMDKEVRKSLRAFKKVIIRRKVVDGNVAKYLLDFGKRRVIPEVVMKHGSVVEEASTERKRYWLNESLVPLHILKNFEEKRIARISNKTSSLKDSEAGGAKKKKFARKMSAANLLETGVTRKKLPGEKGFAYLFSRAERAEYSQCGHCKKDVLIREAASCQFCKGLFHMRHVKISGEAVSVYCTYTCHRCHQDKAVKNITDETGRDPENAVPYKARVGKGNRKAKLISERAKPQPQNYKKALAKRRLVKLRGRRATIGKRLVQSTKGKLGTADLPLRRSARQAAKYVPVQSKSRRGPKKGKQKKPQRGAPKRKKSEASCRKKRTQTFSSYWLNGLYLSRVADDKRVLNFRKKSTFSPDHSTSARRDKVKCSLCGEGSRTSKSTYIACDTCGEWYHGDAFELDPEKMQQIIGFRCHECRWKSPPICPSQSHFPGVQNISIVELSKDVNSEDVEDPSLLLKSNSEAEEELPASKKQKTSPSQD